MNVLIAKLGATGDVVRTTTLLARVAGHVTWITEPKNAILIRNLRPNLRCLAWEERELASDRRYDLIINLEDTGEVAHWVSTLQYLRLFGAYRDTSAGVQYTTDSEPWFDLSLISRFGRKSADRLKFLNRRSYQELLFSGL